MKEYIDQEIRDAVHALGELYVRITRDELADASDEEMFSRVRSGMYRWGSPREIAEAAHLAGRIAALAKLASTYLVRISPRTEELVRWADVMKEES